MNNFKIIINDKNGNEIPYKLELKENNILINLNEDIAFYTSESFKGMYKEKQLKQAERFEYLYNGTEVYKNMTKLSKYFMKKEDSSFELSKDIDSILAEEAEEKKELLTALINSRILSNPLYNPRVADLQDRKKFEEMNARAFSRYKPATVINTFFDASSETINNDLLRKIKEAYDKDLSAMKNANPNGCSACMVNRLKNKYIKDFNLIYNALDDSQKKTLYKITNGN